MGKPPASRVYPSPRATYVTGRCCGCGWHTEVYEMSRFMALRSRFLNYNHKMGNTQITNDFRFELYLGKMYVRRNRCCSGGTHADADAKPPV